MLLLIWKMNFSCDSNNPRITTKIPKTLSQDKLSLKIKKEKTAVITGMELVKTFARVAPKRCKLKINKTKAIDEANTANAKSANKASFEGFT